MRPSGHRDQLAQARADAGVESVPLSNGVTAYEISGGDGPWVVLLHGILTPMLTWDRLVPELVSAGLRVLRYDAYGRGLSDRPAIRYDPALYVRQLREVLETFGIRRATLVGWSMGAATCLRLAREHPEYVARLALIAPALRMPRPPGLNLGLRVPGLSNVLDVLSGPIARAAMRSQLDNPRRYPEYLRGMKAQARLPGLGASLASTLTFFPWGYGDDLPDHAISIPTLVVWGKADPTVAFSGAGAVGKLFEHVQWCVIERAKHAPHYEYAEQIGAALRAFVDPSWREHEANEPR